MAQQITNLKDKPKQKFKVQIDDGDMAEFVLYFLPSQQGWFFDIKYGNFEATGLRLVNSCNVLRSYFNLLRFGLSCQVVDGSEPYFVDDLSTGRIKLFILSEEEVVFIEELFND